MQSENQFIDIPLFAEKNISLSIKREDLIHPIISGNKYRKLKYNLLHAKEEGFKKLLTYGGAFSNHILAVAAAGKENGLDTIGVIRGDELEEKWEVNPTLALAKNLGMCFKFVSREQYRQNGDDRFVETLKKEFGNFYAIPEGGTNALAIKGCEEILFDEDKEFDIVATCVGTGGTLAGLINSSAPNQEILGFSALKGNFLLDEIRSMTTKKIGACRRTIILEAMEKCLEPWSTLSILLREIQIYL